MTLKRVLLILTAALAFLALCWSVYIMVCAIVLGRVIEQNMPGIIVEVAREKGANMTLSREAAEAFLDDLAANHADAAYARTSKDFQRRHELERFQAFTNQQPVPRNRSHQSFHYVLPDPGEPIGPDDPITYEVIIKNERGGLCCTLRLLQENGSWKIDEFSIP